MAQKHPSFFLGLKLTATGRMFVLHTLTPQSLTLQDDMSPRRCPYMYLYFVVHLFTNADFLMNSVNLNKPNTTEKKGIQQDRQKEEGKEQCYIWSQMDMLFYFLATRRP